ncbi:hypothetical protein QR680_018075 [Steinernema hermaphroditum]|uniref:non-specific serine/threonine protein kinase n=1 Tax=Steinernema hermaphroditum TaxID=289476 RepID=A0AA39HGU8_9BILA|nr:hypothetical protein QR680_018075 [Steinernema hermaphroditum]
MQPQSPSATVIHSTLTEPPKKKCRRCLNDSLDRFHMIFQSPLETVEYRKDAKSLYLFQCFNVDALIGSGSFGDVLAVTAKSSGRQSAVKIAKKEVRLSKYDEQLREVRVHQSIQPHENVVRFEGAWFEARLLFVQTELCVSNLAVFRKSPLFSTGVLIHAVHDVVAGVHHLHSGGVLHVDLKPENVFVTEKGVCKIGDLGIAVHVGEVLPKDFHGDGRYLSLDLLNGTPSTKTDVYSLSMTLLEISLGIDLPSDFSERKKLRCSTSLRERLRILGRLELFAVIRPGLSSNPSKRPEVADMLSLSQALFSRYGARPDISWAGGTKMSAFSVINRLPPPSRTPQKPSPKAMDTFATPDFEWSPKTSARTEPRTKFSRVRKIPLKWSHLNGD